jgi:hypothetical protein
MHSLMLTEVRATEEAFPTLPTLVRRACTMCLLVDPQRGGVHEGLPTDCALVRFLSRVNCLVFQQG